jgi:hypothetical protein
MYRAAIRAMRRLVGLRDSDRQLNAAISLIPQLDEAFGPDIVEEGWPSGFGPRPWDEPVSRPFWTETGVEGFLRAPRRMILEVAAADKAPQSDESASHTQLPALVDKPPMVLTYHPDGVGHPPELTLASVAVMNALRQATSGYGAPSNSNLVEIAECVEKAARHLQALTVHAAALRMQPERALLNGFAETAERLVEAVVPPKDRPKAEIAPWNLATTSRPRLAERLASVRGLNRPLRVVPRVKGMPLELRLKLARIEAQPINGSSPSGDTAISTPRDPASRRASQQRAPLPMRLIAAA